MADIKALKRMLKVANGSRIVIGCLWLVTFFLLAGIFTNYQTAGSLITGHVVEQTGSGAAKLMPAGNYYFSLVIYVAGFVLFGGAVFVMSRRSGELKHIIDKEEKERMLSSSPKRVIEEFFEILANWSIKNSNAETTHDSLQRIKKAVRSILPYVKNISFGLTPKKDDITVQVVGAPSWKEAVKLFRVYLDALEVDRERLVHIAEYLGKEDMSIALARMDELDPPAPPKQLPVPQLPKAPGKSASRPKKAASKKR